MPCPRPDDQVLLDHAMTLIRKVFGPDEEVADIRITTIPFRLVITTDHGGRITVDTDPSVN